MSCAGGPTTLTCLSVRLRSFGVGYQRITGYYVEAFVSKKRLKDGIITWRRSLFSDVATALWFEEENAIKEAREYVEKGRGDFVMKDVRHGDRVAESILTGLLGAPA